VFCEKEFGVELEAKVSDMWAPRDDGVSETISYDVHRGILIIVR